MTDNLHHRILATLTRRYEQRIMNNVCRSDYVECMVASVLGADWRLTWADGWDWAPWDCEHAQTGARLEIKQAAARQSWDHGTTAVRRRPVFDIAARQGYWPRDGGPWIEAPGRLAHLYVFAWHVRHDEHADHRNAEQELPEIPPRQKGKRGRVAKSDAHNLHERLAKHEESVLRFMGDPDVSFTNNTGEQKIRMAKVKIKVSGCFRTRLYAEAWCRISSYLSSMAALGYNPLVAIQIALAGKAADMIKMHYAQHRTNKG